MHILTSDGTDTVEFKTTDGLALEVARATIIFAHLTKRLNISETP